MNKRDQAIEQLLELGITSNLLGHHAILEILELCEYNSLIIAQGIMVLYNVIDKKLDCRTERAIRHVIELSYNRNSSNKFYDNFKDKKPRNSEFIACLIFKINSLK